MPLSLNAFSPSTTIESSPMNSNFTDIQNAINNLRPFITWYVPGEQVVGTNLTAEYEVKQSLTIVEPVLSVKTNPTDASLIVDINKNGTTIFSTRPEIDSGSTTEDGNHVLSVTTASAGDVFTFDVDQIGSTLPGEDLTCQLFFRI